MLRQLKNLTADELREWTAAQGEPAFRSRQLLKWIYSKRLDSFGPMDDLPKAARAKFAASATIRKLAERRVLSSKAGDAVKFVFGLEGSGGSVESVLLYDDKRRTACLSSQLGCALGCAICATARMGFVRNLSQAEIVGQLIGINDYLAARADNLVDHVVFMGMGEALSNFEPFQRACALIMDPDGFALSGRRITVSTAGVVPSIERLARQGPPVGLAVSLNEFSDERRDRLMPVNRRYPIERVVAAARGFVERTGRALTFEYVVIEGENDGRDAVDALCRLLRGLRCKVNCIPLSKGPYRRGKTSSARSAGAFADALFRRGLIATVRKSRGGDIRGACGQLATGTRAG